MPSVTRSETDRLSRSSTTEEDRHAPTLRATPQARRYDELPASSEYAAFIANVASTAPVDTAGGARDTAVQAKLNALRDAFSGPYRVSGGLVSARPMFRMTTHEVPQRLALEVDLLGARAGVRAPYATRVGQGAPRDLVAITQALIDAGRLPSEGGDLASRIRKMQWAYGIGVDCAGYAKQALAASADRMPRLYAPGAESFRDLDGARASGFLKLSIENARPGDLVTLDPIYPEQYGHNVVVYSRVTADAARKATFGACGPDARAFFATSGPHHVLEVDSSWGAGAHGADHGGFRRDTWIYDASSKCWGSFEPGTSPPAFVSSPKGPAADAYHATYRPR